MGLWIRDGFEDLVKRPIDVYVKGYYGAGCPVCGAGLETTRMAACEHVLAVQWLEASWQWLGDLQSMGDFDLGYPDDEVEEDEVGEEEVEEDEASDGDEGGDGANDEDYDEDEWEEDEYDEFDQWGGLLPQLADALARPSVGTSRGPATLPQDWVAVCVFWSEEPHPFASCAPTLVAWPIDRLPPLEEGVEAVREAICLRAREVGHAFEREMTAAEESMGPRFDGIASSTDLGIRGVRDLVRQGGLRLSATKGPSWNSR